MQSLKVLIMFLTVVALGLATAMAEDPTGSNSGYTPGGSADDPDDPNIVRYYWPYGNNPPGPPPNYNLVDSSYFQGVPILPEPTENNLGGYYIYNDTAAGKWYITNQLYSKGNSLEQFHGSILAEMDQEPAPGINF